MTQRIINLGGGPNSRDGDPLRIAFDKINQNFTDLFSTDTVSTYQIGDETQFIRIELDGEGVPTGGITLQSGYDTSMPVYIKGGNCAQDGVGGNVIIEAGAPPLATPQQLIEGAGPYAGTVGDIEMSANQTTIDSLGNTWTFGSDGNLQFPTGCFIGDTYSDGSLSLQATTNNYVGLNSSDLKQYLEVNDSGIYIGTDYPANDYSWVFDKSGILNLPASINENAVIQSPYSIELIAGTHSLLLDTSGNLTLDGNPVGSGGGSTGDITFSNSSMSSPSGDTMVLLATSGLTDSMELSLGNKQANLYAFNGQNLTQLVLDNSSLHPVAQINIGVNAVYKTWTFDENGVLGLPAGGDIVNSSGVTVLDKSVRAVSFWSTATPAQIISPTEDVIMCDTQAAGGTVGFIMPSPGSISVGKTVTIKNIHGNHAIYVSGSAGGTVAIETEFGNVGTGAYATISANNAFATFIWDGSAWRIINRHGI